MRRLALIALGATLLPWAASAQTVELASRKIARPPTARPVAPPAQIQLKYLGVKTSIENQVAQTEIDQTFHNPNNWQAEGTYLFPLPDGTTVTNFVMYMGGKAMKGEVLDRAKATQVYESIVRKRQDPGLLEFIGHRLIRARVFPIPAKGDVRIKLKFSRVLKADGRWFEYGYPLSSAGKRIGETSFEIRIKNKTAIKTVYSPSHEVDVTRKSDNEVLVRYEKRDLAPERGLALLYGVSEKDMGLHLLTHRRKGEDGYFMLGISPKVAVSKADIVPKSIVFVVDTSGSMAGQKMEQAQKALAFCINSLDDRSHFGLIQFNTEVEAHAEKLQPVTAQTRKAALGYIEDLEAVGGTNIDEALEMALEMASGRKELTEIVFLTDGKPTIGERDSKRILANVKRRNTGGVRLFVFGVGENLNTHLLDKLAEDNRGVRTYVMTGESIERKVSSLYRKIESPVLTDLALELGKIGAKDVFPRDLGDLFRGDQLLVIGRYKDSGHEAVELKGKVAGQARSFTYEGTFAATDGKNDFLPRLWAHRKVSHLLDQIRLHGENDELKKEVIALAKRYGIVTEYTSALVLEDEFGRRIAERKRPGNLESRFGGGRKAPDPSAKPDSKKAPPEKKEDSAKLQSELNKMKKVDGQKAVRDSRKLKQMKRVQTLEAEESDEGAGGKNIRKVGAKTFLKDGDGFWVDSTLTKKTLKGAQVVKYLSKEYFELARKDARLAKLLKVGKKMIVEYDGSVYRIE